MRVDRKNAADYLPAALLLVLCRRAPPFIRQIRLRHGTAGAAKEREKKQNVTCNTPSHPLGVCTWGSRKGGRVVSRTGGFLQKRGYGTYSLEAYRRPGAFKPQTKFNLHSYTGLAKHRMNWWAVTVRHHHHQYCSEIF